MEAVRGMVWIFSGIAQCYSKQKKSFTYFLKFIQRYTNLTLPLQCTVFASQYFLDQLLFFI